MVSSNIRTNRYWCCSSWRLLALLFTCVLFFSPNLVSFWRNLHLNQTTKSTLDDVINWTSSRCPDIKLDPTTPWPISSSKCTTPATRLGFLKTHKCASTTLQNIFLRFAHKKALNVVLPKYGNYLSRQIPFDVSMASWHSMPTNGFHLVAHHMIWNQEAVAQLLGPDALFVSVVRDPVEQFESLYSYSNLDTIFGVPLEAFSLSKNKSNRRVGGNVGRNQMMFDFGFPPASFDNECDILQKIALIESQFDLIMVVDQFDESLVLLNKLLCWPWEDLAYFKLNSRKSASVLSKQAESELRKWLRADQILYDYFSVKFKATLAAVGKEELDEGLRKLGEANEKVQAVCGFYYVKDASRLPKSERPYQYQKLKGVTAKNESDSCLDFTRTENSFTDLMRDEMMRRLRRV